MIQIIKRGTREVTDCPVCGCKFSYEQEDVINKVDDNYKAYKFFVPCPQCNINVILEQSK